MKPLADFEYSTPKLRDEEMGSPTNAKRPKVAGTTEQPRKRALAPGEGARAPAEKRPREGAAPAADAFCRDRRGVPAAAGADRHQGTAASRDEAELPLARPRLGRLGQLGKLGQHAAWARSVAKLAAFKAVHGHCNLPWFSEWVSKQQQKLDRGEPCERMSAARAAELDALGLDWHLLRPDA